MESGQSSGPGEGLQMLHAGGGGKTIGVGVNMNEDYSKEVITVEMGRQDHCSANIGWRTDDVHTVSICITDGENARRKGCILK